MGLFKDRKSNLGYFILSFIILFIVSFFMLFFMEREIRSSKLTEIKQNELNVMDLQINFLSRDVGTVISDLKYLNNGYSYLLQNPDNYNDIKRNWTQFFEQKRVYSNIKYIDHSGVEQINIVFDKNRISPTLKLVSPVYDQNNNNIGEITIEYMIKDLMESFRALSRSSYGDMLILNDKGIYVSYEKESNQFDFSRSYPQKWELIKAGDGQFVSNDGIFTFRKVSLDEKIVPEDNIQKDKKQDLGYGNWYIVSIVTKDVYNTFYMINNPFKLGLDVLRQNFLYFFFIIIIAVVMGFLLYVNRKTYDKIKYFSEYDVLTKVYNRRAGLERLNVHFPINDRRHFLVSLCFIDINGLKEINDTLGHKYGDDIIFTVANVINNSIREHDFVMRLGGDEFLVVFNGIDTDVAEKVWKRISKAYDDINNKENRPYIISVSHGIIDYNNSELTNIDELISKADEKMYKEKQILKENLHVVRE